ncbi:MAG: NAD(P)-dependent oxidoreductase [Alphaproteobacteria bacterium]|nr:NAD(P)-dependent oxidoreductase [Alphaproteobacteria bacterium]
MNQPLPARFDSIAQLEEVMTRPSAALAADLARLPGDIAVLGVGGKMGPTLARLAKRAAPGKRIVGVARFSEKGLRESLEKSGVECVPCDLLDRAAVERLPKVPNLIYMAGRKFGSQGAEHLTWAMNALVPGYVAEAFKDSRIVAFSTGCVYPFVPVAHGGPTEATPPNPPSGEYANSCLARERVFEYGSRQHGTKAVLFRLNYAIDMRYGVLFDVASAVKAGKPLDLTMGHVNVIWQGDANAMALRALLHAESPAKPLNVTGPEILSVRWLAEEFGRRFGVKPNLTGSEAANAWLNNASHAFSLFGYPGVPLSTLIDWTADWVGRDMASLGKPTHFEVRDGVF